MEIPLINVVSCLPNKQCPHDLCPQSGTEICCMQCGTPQHISDINKNYEEMAKLPEWSEHPLDIGIVLQSIKEKHQCNGECPSCRGGHGLRIYAASA